MASTVFSDELGTPIVASWLNDVNDAVYGYNGNVKQKGAVGDGVTDDTNAIIAAAATATGKGLIFPAGTYRITNEITLNNVYLFMEGNVLITGSGSIRGVVANDVIPHSKFQVPYNLVTTAEREPSVVIGDFYIDPLLGVDTNTGTTSAVPLRTLTAAAAKIAGVAATAPSLTLVLRSGRHELAAGLLLTGSHSLTSGGNVTWTANGGEVPIVSAATKWFFKSSPITAIYNRYTGVANTAGYAFFDLYDAETGAQVECASNMGPGYSLPRNQVAAVSGGGATCSITLNTEDATNFAALSATEKASSRLRITQWFSSSLHMSLSIAGSVLTGDCQTSSVPYYNGWNSIPIDPFGAPYLLQNVKAALDGTNFCGYSDNVFLPTKGSNFFTVDNSLTYLINTGTAAKHFFRGLSFRYLAAGFNTVKNFYNAGPFPSVGLLLNANGADSCEFAYSNVNGVVLPSTGGVYRYNKLNMLGCSGITFNNVGVGSNSCTLQHNTVRRWGHITSLAGIGIWAGGVGVIIERNDTQNGPWTGIRVESGANITAPSGTTGGVVSKNLVKEIGYIDGKPADLIACSDAGAITVYGGVACTYQIIENAVGRSFSYGLMRGIFGDDGTAGCQVNNNIIWGFNYWGIDFRQVGNNTANNTWRGNIIFGPVNLASFSANSDFAGNLVQTAYGNVIDNTNISATTANTFGFRGDGTQEWPTMYSKDPAFTATPSATMTAWPRSFLKLVDGVTDAPLFANQKTLTTSGGTVTATDQDITSSVAGANVIALPDPKQSRQVIYIRTTTANTVSSSLSNVIPLAGGSASSAILSATAGKWARLISDGTNWVITQAN